MTLHCGPSFSVYKVTTLPSVLPSVLPSTLARDFNNTNNTNNNEAMHERKSIQSLIDSSKKPPYTRIDTVLTNFFPEVGDVPGRPSFLQKMDLDEVDEKSSPVLRTNHPNLLNILDISVCGDKLFFHYERPGISLGRLQKSTMLDRVAVATICKKLLHGLVYIHEGLNVSHGHLHCGGIYLSDEGEIKIGDVGKSMTEKGKAKDVPCDVQAVFQIASQLLSLDRDTDTTSMSWLIAKNFVTMPSTVNPRTLLKHPFLRLGQGSWYLSSIGGLLSFVRTTGLNDCLNPSPSDSDEKTSGKEIETIRLRASSSSR